MSSCRIVIMLVLNQVVAVHPFTKGAMGRALLASQQGNAEILPAERLGTLPGRRPPLVHQRIPVGLVDQHIFFDQPQDRVRPIPRPGRKLERFRKLAQNETLRRALVRSLAFDGARATRLPPAPVVRC